MARRNFFKAYNDLVTNSIGQSTLNGLNGAADLVHIRGIGSLVREDVSLRTVSRNVFSSDARAHRRSWTASKVPSIRAGERMNKDKKKIEQGINVGNSQHLAVSHHERLKKKGLTEHESIHSVRAPKSSGGKKYYKYISRESRSQLKQQKSADEPVKPCTGPAPHASSVKIETAPYEVPKFTSQFYELFRAGERKDLLVSITDPTPPSMQRWAVEWNSEPKNVISVAELKKDLMRETGERLEKDSGKTDGNWVSVQNINEPISPSTSLRRMTTNNQNQAIQRPSDLNESAQTGAPSQFNNLPKDKYNTPTELYSFKKRTGQDVTSQRKERRAKDHSLMDVNELHQREDEGVPQITNPGPHHMVKPESRQHSGRVLKSQTHPPSWSGITQVGNACKHENSSPSVGPRIEDKAEENTAPEAAGPFIETNSSFYHWLQQRGFMKHWLKKRRSSQRAKEPEKEATEEKQFPWSVPYPLKRSASGSTFKSKNDKGKSNEIPVRKAKTETELFGKKYNKTAKSDELPSHQIGNRFKLQGMRGDSKPTNDDETNERPVWRWEVIDETDHVQKMREGAKAKEVWTWGKPAVKRKVGSSGTQKKKPVVTEKSSKLAGASSLEESESDFSGLFGDCEAAQKKETRGKKPSRQFQTYPKRQDEDWSYFEEQLGKSTEVDQNSSQLDFDWHKTISLRNNFSEHICN